MRVTGQVRFAVTESGPSWSRPRLQVARCPRNSARAGRQATGREKRRDVFMVAILTHESISVKIESMNIERSHQLQRRAAKHAALSDPARLRIADLLTLGDLSPGEIHGELGLPQNLISHHLGVLEAEGIVVRSKSEGDKRRSYVHLVDGALDDLAPGSAGTANRVVFVCSANSARSQLAAALWRRVSTVPSASAGTHPADSVNPGALATADRHALPLLGNRPASIEDVVSVGDFIITVCDHAQRNSVTAAACTGPSRTRFLREPMRPSTLHSTR